MLPTKYPETGFSSRHWEVGHLKAWTLASRGWGDGTFSPFLGPKGLICPYCTSPISEYVCTYMWRVQRSISQLVIRSVPLHSGRVSPQISEHFPFCSSFPWSEAGMEQVLPISSLASLSPSVRARRVGGLSVPVARSSELASSPSAPHPLACRAVAQAAVRLSGLATQDRWRGIISASQSAMAAAVGGGGGPLTPSPCVYPHTQVHMQFPTPAPDPAQPPDTYEVGRKAGGERRF